MIADCGLRFAGLRFALCAVLLLAPLAALSAQEPAAQEMEDMTMGDEGSFFVSAAASPRFGAERDVFDAMDTVSVGTGIGILGGRIGAGYAIAEFRPEISVGYHTAPVRSLTVEKIDGSTASEDLEPLNDALAEGGDRIAGVLTSVDLAAGVSYDIDTGTEITPYVGVGGGVSYVVVTYRENLTPRELDLTDTPLALSLQGAVGIGYAVLEDLTLTFGYRLTVTLESADRMGMAVNHDIELGLRYAFSLPF